MDVEQAERIRKNRRLRVEYAIALLIVLLFLVLMDSIFHLFVGVAPF